MTTPTCHYCGQSGSELEALLHPPTGEAIWLCMGCLRALSRAKAAWSDEAGCKRLKKVAKGGEHEVWRSDHVLYLLPSFSETSPGLTQKEPPQPTGER